MISAQLSPIIMDDKVANVAEVAVAAGLCRTAGGKSPDSVVVTRDRNAKGEFGILSVEDLAQLLEDV